MDTRAKRNFILQQGFPEPTPGECPARFSALLFQPWLIALAVAAGIALQSPAVFLALAAVLWWSALLPRWNPFDLVHDALFARRGDRPPSGPAPEPRRFAMVVAGGLTAGIGLALIQGSRPAAFALEAVLVAALAGLLFGRFCLGSFLFHLLRGRWTFVRATLPWAREEPGR